MLESVEYVIIQTHHHVHRNRQWIKYKFYRSSSCDSAAERATSPSPSSCEDGTHKPKIISRRMGKRNIKAQVKRFRMETKAAKTLGIIVGGFIFCWLPFFTIYLVRAFCEDCFDPLLFSVLFWLGYCNSAINPLIYALFSKDFRFAFKRIICKCFCKRRSGGASSRRGSDGSQMQGRQFRSPSYNAQPPGNSLGEDSDPAADPSDSRWRSGKRRNLTQMYLDKDSVVKMAMCLYGWQTDDGQIEMIKKNGGCVWEQAIFTVRVILSYLFSHFFRRGKN